MGILSSIGGFLFGSPKSKTKESGKTDMDPWDKAIPYLEDYLKQTKALYGTAPMISPYEQQGYDQLAQTVGAGNIALDPAIAENNKTLSGDYLNPETNPYIKDIASRMAGLATSNINTTFGSGGRTNSGLAAKYGGQGAAEAAGDIFYKNYGDERARMGSAVGMAPQLEAGRYLGPQAMISAGQNISARPFDVNQMYGSAVAGIGSLGQQGVSSGTAENHTTRGGILNSFVNKLFGG
jgi:hypothetical protein